MCLFSSIHAGSSFSGIFKAFFLLSIAFQDALQPINDALLFQRFQSIGAVVALAKGECVDEEARVLQQLTGIDKAFVRVLGAGLGGIADFSVRKQGFIGFQHVKGVTLPFQEVPANGLYIRRRGWHIILCQSEIRHELAGDVQRGKPEESGGEIHDVARCVAAKTIEVVVVELEARFVVVVERAENQLAGLRKEPVALGCLLHGDVLFRSFKKVQVFLFLTSLILPAKRAYYRGLDEVKFSRKSE